MSDRRRSGRRRIAPRLAGVALVLLALPLLAGGSWVSAAAQTSSVDPAMVKSVCQIPNRQLLRIWHGTRPDWGVDIVLQAKFPNFVSGGLSHSGPWPYLQHVPIFFYGPGIIPARGSVSRPVLSTDIAPTEAALLKFSEFHAPDGKVMPEVLPNGGVTKVPKLLVTFVWDAAGLDVLDTWPKAWPYLKSLIPKGVWFSRATIGSSPSNTPPIHATIGTGAFPMHSGILDEFQRVNGEIQKPQEDGPAFELVPTLADLYDRDHGNKPLVGEIATLSSHMGMIGHGSMWGGGDRDIAVTREHLFAATGGAEGNTWDLTPGEAPVLPDAAVRELGAGTEAGRPPGRPVRRQAGRRVDEQLDRAARQRLRHAGAHDLPGQGHQRDPAARGLRRRTQRRTCSSSTTSPSTRSVTRSASTPARSRTRSRSRIRTCSKFVGVPEPPRGQGAVGDGCSPPTTDTSSIRA